MIKDFNEFKNLFERSVVIDDILDGLIRFYDKAY
jgi:hypothetical protein